MQLLTMRVNGFRSLNQVEIDFRPLTIFIGENDSGKSSVLDMLELFISNGMPTEEDYHLNNMGESCDSIEVTLILRVDENEIEALKYSVDNTLVVRKRFFKEPSSQITEYWGLRPIDDSLIVDFGSLSAQQQRDLILEHDPSIKLQYLSNKSKRIKRYKNILKESPKERWWVNKPIIPFGLLPEYERYRAFDYTDPSSVMKKTLQRVFEQTIYETNETNPLLDHRLIKSLQDVELKAIERIRRKIRELEKHIERYNNRVLAIDYKPEFDFSKSLKPGEFYLDRGYGLHALSKIGDGTKRRMFMAVTDWDREITIEQMMSHSGGPNIIRGYDEPDTNLHYEAQRLMFSSISEIVNTENSRTQAILCTHSLTMIDRAPANTIRLFTQDANGDTIVHKLKTDGDPEIEEFLKNISTELGITNSIMFYERCFIFIEGETEEFALPILYRKLFGHSLIEDCIRLVNVQRNCAVKEFLKLFAKNRKELILVFVDSDSENSNQANLTRKKLQELGYDKEFINERFIFIGEKELEDAFPTSSLVRALETKWPKANGSKWENEEIEGLRSKPKFSKALDTLVRELTPEDGEPWTKPIFGRFLAETCDKSEIPEKIVDLFNLANKISHMEH
jgi:putative ATP-dependent endonuclease of OLD family